MNKFQVVGRYTSNPELRYTKDNKPVASFTIATNNSKDDTTYIKISAFGSTAEAINKYSKKGDLVLIDGIIKNNNYEDDKGNKHYDYQFLANRVEFLSRATNNIPEDKSPKKQDKNSGLDDSIFADFGNKIDIDEKDLAF